MVMKKVLVTGGSGYLGARICLHLANQGYAVTPLCHSKVPEDDDWISKMDNVIVGDVRDEKFLCELAKNKYDVLIHLVSLDHNQSKGMPSEVSPINITPVWSLLDIFSKYGLKKFLYFSTAQVYGNLENDTVIENHIMNTQNAYSLTHQIGEVICEYYNRTTELECKIIRLSNSYGSPLFKENNCWWLVINDLCRMAYTQKNICLLSDGSPFRDFIHGWDVCRGVQSIIESSKKDIVYNLSSGVTLSIMEIAEKIKDVFASRYGILLKITSGVNNNNNVPKRYKLENSLIRNIGFVPEYSIEKGINEIFDYLEQNDN